MERLGAKAPHKERYLFAALKRCATQKLYTAVESHFSQRTREMGHPVFLVRIMLFRVFAGD